MQLTPRDYLHLDKVHPSLVACVERAARITTQPFAVVEGVRSAETQLEDWRRHVSKLNGIPVGTSHNGIVGTGLSRHQIQPDGYGHAVDLVPVDPTPPPPRPRWEWPLIYPVAVAMARAAVTTRIELRWGGVWDRRMSALPLIDLSGAVHSYVIRHAGPDFLDGPHYEIVA